MNDGTCYCKDKFSSKLEILNQNLLMNVIEQHYLIQIWKPEIVGDDGPIDRFSSVPNLSPINLR